MVKIDLARLAELVKANPDATIKELHALLGADCVESAVCMALKRLGLSFKKKRSTRRSKTARTSPGGVPRGGGSSRRSTPNA